ncbi:hypothetical protein [Flavobacterium sp.]|uniref:hypothetical protein n=1 Tax=Flavobacterium sp. TaxID=239 RepID=UPI003751EAAB
MKNKTFCIVVFLSLSLLGCKKIQNKLNKISIENAPKSISISDMVKDFKDDKSIKEIKGIQVEDLFYKEYFLYTGNKKTVIEGMNKIKVTEGFSQDCILTSKAELYQSLIESDKNEYTAFFWEFEKLKNPEIYTCTKGLIKHFIIFDLNSDTIYQRAEEIRE